MPHFDQLCRNGLRFSGVASHVSLAQRKKLLSDRLSNKIVDAVAAGPRVRRTF